MNRLKTIVLFAGIFGIGLGAVSLSGISSTSLMVAETPQTVDNFGMLGHVEYKLVDESGITKQYLQGDNTVVRTGKDCVARMVFDNATSDPVCLKGNNEFQYIAVGNWTDSSGSTPPVDTLVVLDSETPGDGDCAATGDSGEMARKLIVPEISADTGSGTIVVLDTVNDPFDFGGSNVSGAIMQSGIFNVDNPKVTSGENAGMCQTIDPNASMFAVQNLNDDTGITVSSGDSLSVKWTITVG